MHEIAQHSEPRVDEVSPLTPALSPRGERGEVSTRFPLRAWLALAGMVLLIGVGAYAMYERFAGAPVERTDLVEINARRPFANLGQPRVRPDGVRERGRDRYQLKAGDAIADVSKNKEGAWVFRYSYDRNDIATADQQAAITARLRLAADSAYAKSLGLTPEHVQKLKEIPARVGMAVSESDEQQLRVAMDAYAKAAPPRANESEALLALLRDIGNRSLEPTRQAFAERAKQIQSILTPEQVAKFKR
jgi:hypothetical protein